MPLTANEILERLVKATDEAKETIQELHGARATALDVIKKHRAGIVDAINAAVAEEVAKLREEMLRHAGAAVDAIAAELRGRLGLEAK